MKANEEVAQGEEAEYGKTPSTYDRSEPAFAPAPLFTMPKVWKAQAQNGLALLGIVNHEIPIVNFRLTIPGGHMLDPKGKAGLASLTGRFDERGHREQDRCRPRGGDRTFGFGTAVQW